MSNNKATTTTTPAVNPVIAHTRAAVLSLALAATASIRPKTEDKATEQEEKEIKALQEFLRTDPWASKLCSDGYGIPGVRLIAHITGRTYLNRAFPETQKLLKWPHLVVVKSGGGKEGLITTPGNTASYALWVSANGETTGLDGIEIRHADATPLSDEEIKALVERITPHDLEALLIHGLTGPVLRKALFTDPAAAK